MATEIPNRSLCFLFNLCTVFREMLITHPPRGCLVVKVVPGLSALCSEQQQGQNMQPVFCVYFINYIIYYIYIEKYGYAKKKKKNELLMGQKQNHKAKCVMSQRPTEL